MRSMDNDSTIVRVYLPCVLCTILYNSKQSHALLHSHWSHTTSAVFDMLNTSKYPLCNSNPAYQDHHWRSYCLWIEKLQAVRQRQQQYATTNMTSMEHHGMQPTGCMDIETEPSRGAPCQGISGRLTNPAPPYPELHTRKAAVFSVAGVAKPILHLRLLLLLVGDFEPNPGPTSAGCYKSTRWDTSPIICSSCQRYFHRTSSHLTRLQKGIQGMSVCSVPGGVAALPPTMTVTSTSIPSCVPTTYTWSALASPVVWPTPPGCVLHAIYQLSSSLPNPW